MKKIVFIKLLLFISVYSFGQTLSSSNLPIVIINTGYVNGNHVEIVDEPKVAADMKIIYRSDGSRNYLSDQNNPEFLNYKGKIGIEIRGSSSQVLEKKAYGLTTFSDDFEEKRNVSILGMPEENDWVLNSLAFDASLIRNYLSYDMARSTGNYAARGVYCEVIINSEYKGLYIFMEKIKIDSARVNIVEMDNTDIYDLEVTGGYIVKADKTTGGDPVAWTMASYNGSTSYLFDNPDPFEINTAQGNYIKSQFTGFQNLMTAHNSSVANGYPSVIDVPSFIDYMLISEIASNADSYQYSTYFHKDRNGKLRAGPVWDYDLTYGNDLFFWGLDRSHTDVWQFDNWDNTGSRFWKDLYNDPDFKCYLTKRWKELTAESAPLNYDVIAEKIDIISEHISEAAVRENMRWNNSGNRMNEIVSMKTWLRFRIGWINSQLYNYNACYNTYIPPLVISKIGYHPVGSQGFLSEESEFIGITNNSNQQIDLTGIYFRELGLTYQFPNDATIGPNEELVLASNKDIFKQVYGFEPFDEFTRNLSNDTEKLVFADAFGNIIDSVRYWDVDPWPEEADGEGPYLQLIDLNLDNSLASSWKSSIDFSTGIMRLIKNESVNIYPNPVQFKLVVQSPDLIFNSFEIIDLTGRIIKKDNRICSNQFNIDVSDLLPEIYMLRLNCKNGERIVRRFTKLF
ncbi:MAG: CotH kinase family protein [Prolixibacteraceae bacterium]|nr:CotH kinase family protein [Prolixibacteraceae bacterium]